MQRSIRQLGLINDVAELMAQVIRVYRDAIIRGEDVIGLLPTGLALSLISICLVLTDANTDTADGLRATERRERCVLGWPSTMPCPATRCRVRTTLSLADFRSMSGHLSPASSERRMPVRAASLKASR